MKVLLHKSLWNILHHFRYDESELVPCDLIRKVLTALLTSKPDQKGIKKFEEAFILYLKSIGWADDQRERYILYVCEELERNRQLSMFAVLSRFVQLHQKLAENRSVPKKRDEVDRGKPEAATTAYTSRRRRALQELQDDGMAVDKQERSEIMFDGFKIQLKSETSPRKASSSLMRPNDENAEEELVTFAFKRPIEYLENRERKQAGKEKDITLNHSLVGFRLTCSIPEECFSSGGESIFRSWRKRSGERLKIVRLRSFRSSHG